MGVLGGTFTYNARVALEDAEIVQRLRDGDLVIEGIMGDHLAQDGPVAAPDINDGQSTHNASVHKTVSESSRLDPL